MVPSCRWLVVVALASIAFCSGGGSEAVRMPRSLATRGIVRCVLTKHLDWRALPWLLELRTPLNLHHEPIAERALILCGTEDLQAKSAGPFCQLMTREQGSEFSLAWRDRLEFRPMNPAGEFVSVMVALVRNVSTRRG
jgi:hypothetical protein